MIKLVRCDDRLIHGECMTVITKYYSIDQIIVIDNFVASNSIMKTIFKSAVPPNIVLDVFSTSDFQDAVKEALTSSKSTLVLVSTPTSFIPLYDAISDLPKTVNVGPMSKRPDTEKIIYGTHLKVEEIEAVKNLDARGIDVYFNAVPERERADWKDIKNAY